MAVTENKKRILSSMSTHQLSQTKKLGHKASFPPPPPYMYNVDNFGGYMIQLNCPIDICLRMKHIGDI